MPGRLPTFFVVVAVFVDVARGSNPDCDVAIAMKPRIDAFLRQEVQDKTGYPETCRGLVELARLAAQEFGKRPAAGPRE